MSGCEDTQAGHAAAAAAAALNARVVVAAHVVLRGSCPVGETRERAGWRPTGEPHVYAGSVADKSRSLGAKSMHLAIVFYWPFASLISLSLEAQGAKKSPFNLYYNSGGQHRS